MSEKKLHMDPELLISKYLGNEATDYEVLWLEEWVRADDANRDLFVQSKKAFHLAGQKDIQDPDVDLAWEKLSTSVFNEKTETKKVVSIRKNRIRIWQAAAAIAVLVMASVWFYADYSKSDIIKFDTDKLVLVDELPDGSIVSLNQHSKISYQLDQSRNIELVGDAFFEVKKDIDVPFVVKADNITVRVLGTSFYVNAKSNKPDIEVMVKSGRVEVKHEADSLVLAAGQSATFNKLNKTLIKSPIEDINYLSWKTRTLIFDDMKLAEVIDKINEVYDANVVLENQSLENCPITVTFKRQELDSILAIIAETLDLGVVKKDSKIVLSGSSCN